MLVEKSPDQPSSAIKRSADVAIGSIGGWRFCHQHASSCHQENLKRGVCWNLRCKWFSCATSRGQIWFPLLLQPTSSEIINDPAINTIVIATRHHLHAATGFASSGDGQTRFLRKATLPNGRRTFRNRAHLYSRCSEKPLLMVGFNRRFAPMVGSMRTFIREIKRADSHALSRECRSAPAGSLGK